MLLFYQPDLLPAYGEYLHNYEASTTLLRHCLEDPALLQFVKLLESSPECEGLELQDFLLLPFQRVVAYAHIFEVHALYMP